MKKKIKEQPKKNHPDSARIVREFIERLRGAMSETGLSACKLSSRIGLSKSTINKVMRESGDIKISTAIQIAREMNLSLDYLAGIPVAETKPDKKQDVPVPAEPSYSDIEHEVASDEAYAFLDKIVGMQDSDVEFLMDMADVLLKRRQLVFEKLECVLLAQRAAASEISGSEAEVIISKEGETEW